MKLTRARFTTRRMMAAVALASVGLAAARWLELRGQYRAEAKYHEFVLEDLEDVCTHGFYPYCSRGAPPIPMEYNAAIAPLHARFVAYHEQLRRKYARAMRSPWLTVPPDPPLPSEPE